jgi:hypothetical protein
MPFWLTIILVLLAGIYKVPETVPRGAYGFHLSWPVLLLAIAAHYYWTGALL